MTFPKWLGLCRAYAEKRYCWPDLDEESLRVYFDDRWRVYEAVDLEAKDAGIENWHVASGAAAWGHPDTFDLSPYKGRKESTAKGE